jgi:hypothetical protein
MIFPENPLHSFPDHALVRVVLLNMRKVAAESIAPAAGPVETPVQLVCLALLLAIAALAWRIAGVW